MVLALPFSPVQSARKFSHVLGVTYVLHPEIGKSAQPEWHTHASQAVSRTGPDRSGFRGLVLDSGFGVLGIGFRV